MVEQGRGTILLTGATAALRGGARFSCLAVGKFGLRALGQSLAREFGPQGIHVAHIIIDGQIDTARVRSMSSNRETHTLLSPEADCPNLLATLSAGCNGLDTRNRPTTFRREILANP
jgi:NAD(P)-dependent dehydrogenase (short-subunit alcohol dehydrogenase family)